MRLIVSILLFVSTTLFVRPAYAENADARWRFLTRFALSGTSDDSDPAGITVYSGLSLEAALRRELGRGFAAELGMRSESREVDRDTGGGKPDPLGSLEVLPLTLLAQYRPALGDRFRPYAGAGVSLTTVWEKSGFLDTYDVDPHIGPVLQLGLDVAIGARAVLNADVRWNAYTARIVQESGEEFAEVRIDPLTLGLGLGIAF